MKTFSYREGPSGVLHFAPAEDAPATFFPDCQFQEACDLLREFGELTTDEGVKLKDAYHYDGFSWFPAMAARLYFRIFLRFVKYRPLLLQFLDGKMDFTGTPNGSFAQILNVFRHQEIRPTFKQRLLAACVRANNWVAASRGRNKMLLCRLGLGDYRSAEMAEALRKLGAPVLEVVPCLRIKTALQSLAAGGKYYFHGATFSPRGPERRFQLGHLSGEKRKLFETAIRHTESTLAGLWREYRFHRRSMHSWKARLIYSFDDTNEYIFPLLFACRKNEFLTVAHQHAVYLNGLFESAIARIPAEEFPWFDKLIVWGSYWKSRLLEDQVHHGRDIVVGANKSTWQSLPPRTEEKIPSTILIPAEFLGSTAAVGRYVEKFVSCGYKVLFKPKPQRESPEAQLEAYQLSPEIRSQVEIVEKLTPDVVVRIDIIAGTMSTLTYEMLPYQKIIWSLDMGWGDFFLFDLVREGLAHRIQIGDIAPPGQLPAALLTPARVNVEDFFCRESLETTLRKHVLEPLAHASS